MKIIKQIVEYICILFVILQFNTWIVHNADNPNANAIIVITVIILQFLIILFNGSFSLKKKTFKYLIYYAAAIFLLGIFGEGFFDMGFLSCGFVSYILFALLLDNGNVEKYLEITTNVIFIICLISLFFFVFATNFHLIEPTQHIRTLWGNERRINVYYGVYCETQLNNAFSYTGYRNTALFIEGPMLAYPVVLALYYELFLRKAGYRKFVLSVLILTAITSLSTTALILLVVIALIKIYNSKALKNVFRYIIIPLIALMSLLLIIYIMRDKLAQNILSVNTRQDDILSTFRGFLHNPFFGIGYNNKVGLNVYRGRGYSEGLSTGLGAIFAYGGIMWGIWYIIPLFVAIMRYIKNKTNRNEMGFIIITTILLTVTVVPSRLLTVMINVICWRYILDEK